MLAASRYMRFNFPAGVSVISREGNWGRLRQKRQPLTGKDVRVFTISLRWKHALEKEVQGSDEMWGRVMEAEADLYLVKPFGYRELAARVKAILRRYKKAAALLRRGGKLWPVQYD